ncbi:MAG: NADH-quinone oxidoreductase subunit L [Candidatus Omnitrophica bacterium]|nr:NADH-quinone oxidoreductase subunit L [Candidatus Omnitrophota bacterium]
MILTTAWTLLALPLASAAFISVFLRKSPKTAGALATLVMGLCFALTCSLIAPYEALKNEGTPVLESSVRWLTAGLFTLNFGVYFNGLTLVMLLVVTGVATLVFLFSTAYMAGDPGTSRYFACLSFFTFSMMGIVLSPNLIQIFIFWELVGLSSYLLIGFWFEKKEACTAAKKAFMTTRVGDAGMMLGLLALSGFMAAGGIGSFDFTVLETALPSLGIPELAMTLIALGLFLGAAGKSAQAPLHVWLPDAMEGPTPVSALIHAATMVAAGIFLLARIFFIFEASPDAMTFIAWTGGLTAFLAALLALVQTDIKKILAYSTVSQLGYMVLALGVSDAQAGILHLTMHAFFKALLFLGAGSLIHAFHSQDIREMGARVLHEGRGSRLYLFKALPVTSLTFLIGTVSLIGLPPFSGFFSKEEVLAAAAHGPAFLFGLALATVLVTAFYNGRLFTIVFLPGGKTSSHASHAEHPLHEGSPAMTVPLILLAVLSVFGSALPIHAWLSSGKEPSHVAPHGLDPLALISVGAALLGFASAALVYWKRSGRLRDALPWLAQPARVLEHKYFLDDIYDRWVCGALEKKARAADLLERYVITEWTINGLGRLARWIGGGLRSFQTGVVQFYALTFLIGALTILFFMTSGWRF